MKDLLDKLRNQDLKFHMNITGGGTGVVSNILKSGGFSKNFLGANIPYSMAACKKLIGKPFDRFCTERVATILADRAWEEGLKQGEEALGCFGVGVTAKLYSEGQREGRENIAHIVVRHYNRHIHKVIRFTSSNREGQESLLEHAILDAMVKFTKIKESKVFVYAGTFNPFHAGHKEIHDATFSLSKEESSIYEMAISTNPYGKAPRDRFEIDEEVWRIAREEIGDEHAISFRYDDQPLFIDKVKFYLNDGFDKVVFAIGFDTFDRLFLESRDFLKAARENNWLDKVQFLVFERENQNMISMCMEMDTHKMIHPMTYTSLTRIKNQHISSTQIRNENNS